MNTDAYVYLLLCRDGTLYCGWTNDPSARLIAHNSGRGSKYTRSRLPVSMVYCEKIDGGKSCALRREYEIKHMTRSQKLALINKTQDAK